MGFVEFENEQIERETTIREFRFGFSWTTSLVLAACKDYNVQATRTESCKFLTKSVHWKFCGKRKDVCDCWNSIGKAWRDLRGF